MSVMVGIPAASEAGLRAMADSVPVLLANCDAESRYKFVNKPYAERFGLAQEDVIGKLVADVLGMQAYTSVRPYIDRVLAGHAVEFDVQVPYMRGGTHFMRCSYAPERDAAGNVVGWFAAIINIDDRRRAGDALRDSEERYRRLAQLLPVGVYACEAPTGAITYFNDQAAVLWGRAPRAGDTDERFCGSLGLYRPDGSYLPHAECPMAVALREGLSFRNEEVFVQRPDGSRVCVLVNIDPVLDGEGRVVGAVNVFHDVSALKEAQRALREQKENLQTLLDTVPVAVLIAEDAQCRRISGNRAAADLLRMGADGDLSVTTEAGEEPMHVRLLARGLPHPPGTLPVQRAARGEVVRAEEIDLAFGDGSLVHLLVSAQPLYDAAGTSRGAVASALDITDLKKAEIALREADRRKDEFLATLSHELRNPLAPLGTAVGMLDAGLAEPERLAELKGVMERQLSHLVRLIDDLLDVSRISRGKLRLKAERVMLQDVVCETVETSRLIAAAKGQQIELRLPDRPIAVDADRLRLGQVLGNLLHNACKYTPAGGRISVAAEPRGGEVLVTVTDSGIGIAPEKLGSIFEMFSQADQPADPSYGGLGIGLSLAKQLAELHGGTIEARSFGPGRGSEFTVRLPAPAEHEPRTAAASGNGAPAGVAARRKILVVDDNTDAASMLVMLLEMQGHVARAAHDGAAAIEQAEAFRPDVVLLDIGLPKMDGHEVCRVLRGRSWGKEMLIAALTGWGQEEDRRKSIAAGFDVHLVKPIDAQRLTDLLR